MERNYICIIQDDDYNPLLVATYGHKITLTDVNLSAEVARAGCAVVISEKNRHQIEAALPDKKLTFIPLEFLQ